jgi:hypothetical protein
MHTVLAKSKMHTAVLAKSGRNANARRALCPGQRLYSNRRRYIMNNIVEDELDLMGYDDRRYGPGF